MKQQIIFEGVRLFGIKPLGNGCRFGMKFNSKQQDGTYSKGIFVNGKHKEMLQDSVNYTLSGFLTTNVYKDNETLEFVAMTAIAENAPQKESKEYKGFAIDTSEVPF